MKQPDLAQVLDWAQEKAHNGSEPPWAWYQYMKLAETCQAIIKGQQATPPSSRVLKSEPLAQQGNVLQLTAAKRAPSNAQSPEGVHELQLPM